MHKTAVALICLAAASHAHLVQTAEFPSSSANELQALATLLLASNPEAGWQVSGVSAAPSNPSRANRQARSAVVMNGKEEAAPSPSRRTMSKLATAAVAASILGALPAVADVEDRDTSEDIKPNPFNKDAVLQDKKSYDMTLRYDYDCKHMIENMEMVTDMGRGTPNMEDIGYYTKRQMVDFISVYRARPETRGLSSFTSMYSAINTVAGHYQAYGYKYPLPDKRRVQLYETYAETKRALARGK